MNEPTLESVKKSIIDLTKEGYVAGQNGRPDPKDDPNFITALNFLMKDIEKLINKVKQ